MMENVGVSCGKLDQSCEVLSKKNHLLYLDTKDDSYELIPTSEKMKPYKVAIFFSGLERSLKNSKYNLRQDECKAAAYALMGYAGIQLMWCILLILLPIALLFAESSMNDLQSVSIVAAFPIGAVIVMIAVSFMKDAKKYMESLDESAKEKGEK